MKEKKESSVVLSPNLHTSNWKNSSLVNNPGSYNGNLNIKNLAINMKSNNDLVTPKNFQNKFVLIDSAKDINSILIC